MALKAKLELDIRKNGFVQVDKRLNRQTYNLPGHFIVLKNPKLFKELRSVILQEKYTNDLWRMEDSLDKAIKMAKKDKNSRRLMVFNDSNYHEIYQCFTHFHFVYTARNEFDMYVYQRSADTSKLEEDLAFFQCIGSYFGHEVDCPVTKIVVVYGSVHYTKNDKPSQSKKK